MMGQVCLDNYTEYQNRFIKEACDEWDDAVGVLPPFYVFVQCRVLQKWQEMVGKN